MMRMLVVDPNEAFATLLSEELKREGHDVVMCLSGDDALAAARDHPVDMAILDMALSPPGALSLAKSLRDVYPGMRLMLIPLMGEALASGDPQVLIQGVLPKPFFLPELPELIAGALNAPMDPDSTETAGAKSTAESPDVDAPVADDAPPYTVSQDEGYGLSRDAFVEHRIEVEQLMNDLVQDVGADAALLTFNGGLLTWVGGLGGSAAASIARAIVHGWQTSAEVARILGREQVRFEQSIAGGDYMLYALSVESVDPSVHAIMGVAVRGAAPLGLLRHRARAVADRIAQLCAW